MRAAYCLLRTAWALGFAFSALAHWPTGPLAAQKEPLEDNSFLVEEAYNQPARVVQHIATAELHHGATVMSFSQEWPLGGLRHQLSYGIAALDDREFTLGDAEVNYRYQAVGMQGGSLYMAPRLSALVPLGDADRLAGNGGWGAEVELPVSWQVSDLLSLHTNVGASWRPRAEGADGTTASSFEPSVGLGATIFVASRFNLIAEAVWQGGQEVVAGKARGNGEYAAALGARAGFDLPNGLQVVPGVAWMPAIADTPTRSFLYLSFEHGF